MLVITRAEPDASAMVEELRGRGVEAVAVPAIAFTDVPGEPAAVTARRGQATDVLVASPRAAEVLLRQGIDPLWRVLALAPRTASLLPGSVPVAGGGAALASLARGVPIVLRSDIGGEEIRERLPEVIDWVAYRTTCPTRIELPEPCEILVMSPSAVINLERRAPGALARATRVWWMGGTTRAALEGVGVEGRRWGG